MDQQMNPVDRAIWFAGGVAALAKQLGISHSDVSKWKHRKKSVAYKHRIAIEQLTKGVIRAVDFED
jgi:DNA-binding transcriptional regulator YdaS (Cro superfamily)